MWIVRIEKRRAAIHQAMQKGNSLMRDQPRKKRKHRVRRILLTLLVVLVLAAVGYNTYSQMKAEYTVTYDGYTAKVKVDHCICWSSSITSTASGNTAASSGAIIGFTHKGNWMYCSYYNPNMAFSGINAGNTLVSQNGGKGYNTDITGSTAPMVPGTTAGTSVSGDYTHVMPYHGGTVASSGRSACTVAQAIGFASRTNASSEPIWELFSGSTYNANFIMPELKQLRESSDSPGAISDLNKNSIFEEGDF